LLLSCHSRLCETLFPFQFLLFLALNFKASLFLLLSMLPLGLLSPFLCLLLEPTLLVKLFLGLSLSSALFIKLFVTLLLLLLLALLFLTFFQIPLRLTLLLCLTAFRFCIGLQFLSGQS